jgi:tetratricopeptide (TPR) repeat protein
MQHVSCDEHYATLSKACRAMTRHGSCLIKKGDLEGAVAVLNKALTEHRTADTLKLRNQAEKMLKQQQEDAYVDLSVAEEEKNKGNEAFKESKYPEAIACYTEALRRGPPGKWDEAYKVFSNRAACYSKLGAFPEGFIPHLFNLCIIHMAVQTNDECMVPLMCSLYSVHIM